MKLTKKLAALGTAGAIVIGGSIAGYAFWTTNGSGSGSASIGNDHNNVVLTGTSADTLYPGGAAADLDIATSNPNTYSVALTGQVVSISSVMCGATNVTAQDWFEVVDGTIDSTTVTPPKAGATNGTANLSNTGVTIRMNDDATDSQDVCKNSSVTFALSTADPAAE